jgi:hypothetical protein
MPIDEALNELEDNTLSLPTFEGIVSYKVIDAIHKFTPVHIFVKDVPIKYLQKTNKDFIYYMEKAEKDQFILDGETKRGLQDFINFAEMIKCGIIYEYIKRDVSGNEIIDMKSIALDSDISEYSYIKLTGEIGNRISKRAFELNVTVKIGGDKHSY